MQNKLNRRKRSNIDDKKDLSFQDGTFVSIRRVSSSHSVLSEETSELINQKSLTLKLFLSNEDFDNEKALTITVNNNNINDLSKFNSLYRDIVRFLENSDNYVDSLSNIFDIANDYENFYKSPLVERKIKDEFYKNSNKKFNNNNDNNQMRNIPIFMIIDHLCSKGYLINTKEVPAGQNKTNSDVYIKKSNKDLRLSHLSREAFFKSSELNTFEIGDYYDWKHNKVEVEDRSGDLSIVDFKGNGAYSFISMLDSLGAFEDIELNNRKALPFKIINEILKDDTLKDSIENKKFSNFNGIKPNLQIRLPLESFNQRSKDAKEFFINFLAEKRMIDRQIIEREFRKGKFYVANYMNKDNTFTFEPDLFVGMNETSINGGNLSAERFIYNEEKNKLEKIHIRSRKNLTYSVMNDNPKMTFISEASLDALSLENLMKIASNLTSKINERDYNYVSVMGCGNIISWLEDNFNVSFDHNKDDLMSDDVKVYHVKNILEYQEVDEASLKLMTEQFKKINFYYHFPNAKKHTVEDDENYKLLKEFLNFVNPNIKLKVLDGFFKPSQYKNNEDSSYNNYILDKTNVQLFLKESGISFQKKSNNYNFFRVFSTKEKTEINKDSVEMIEEIKRLLVSKLGTENLCLAYDNDVAGMAYIKGFKKMCNILNIKNSVLIPQFTNDINYEVGVSDLTTKYFNDTNDILKEYKRLLKNKGFEESKKFIYDYIRQITYDITKTELFSKLCENADKVNITQSIAKKVEEADLERANGNLEKALSKTDIALGIVEDNIEGVTLDDLLKMNGIDIELLSNRTSNSDSISKKKEEIVDSAIEQTYKSNYSYK